MKYHEELFSFIQDFVDILRGKVPYMENILAAYNVYKNIKDYETLALGSSHMTGYMPKENGMNMSISSQDLYYSYELYKILNNQNPDIKNIILSFSVFSPGHCLIKTNECNMTILYKILFGIDYQYPEIAKAKHFDLIEKFYENKIRKYCDKISYIEGYRGGMPENYFGTSSINPDKARITAIKHYKNNQRECSQMHLLKAFIKDVQKNNQNLYILIMPCPEEYRKILPPKEVLFESLKETILNESNVKLIDLYDAAEYNNDEFLDEHHLNIKGAKKLSKYINNIIEGSIINA